MTKDTLADYARLIRLLPDLLNRVKTAQTKLETIEGHIATALDGVNKSNVAPLGSLPKFTPAFEDASSLFRLSIEEIANVLTATCNALDQTTEATSYLMTGVAQLGVPTRPSLAKIEVSAPKTDALKDLSQAISMLDARLARKSRT